MGKYRMQEPWGYREENDYQSNMPTVISIDGLFSKVEYNKDKNKMFFYDKNEVLCGTIDVSQFEEEKIVEEAYYDKDTEEIVIKFVNGDVVRINVKDILDVNEFKDGLQVIDGDVSVLIDAEGEGYEGNPYLTTSLNGIKIAGIDKHIHDDVEAERVRAIGEETRIEAKLDQEIADRIADVDEEENRAKTEESALNRRVDRLNDELDAEESIREAADVALGLRVDGEISRATSAETTLDRKIDAETERAENAEAALDDKVDNAVSSLTSTIENEISNREAQAIHSAEYVKSDNKIYFKNANDEAISEVDTTDFIVDGMIDDVKIENGNLVIAFNTDAGKQDISIPLTEIFDPSNYYTKDDVDEKVATINENIASETTARQSGDTALDDKITALEGVVDTKANAADVTEEIASATTDMATQTWVNEGLELKADKETTYTQTEVDALIKAKETEIYNLTKLVGEIGGNVTYNYPNELGTSLTELLKNNGTVKLGEDATITRFGPGVTAKNKVTLNLNNHNLTSTAASSYGAIMARGTQQITIGGKGTIDAGNGICIEANGTSTLEPIATFNLTGSTTVYRNNNPGGELIYCYVGTINITNGTFRNDGGSEYMLNCYDANYQAGTAKIIVTGGKFYDFNPADNKAEGEHTSFVPEGYHVETSTVTEEGVEHIIYTVKKDA